MPISDAWAFQPQAFLLAPPPPPPTTRSGATEADAPDGSGYVQISLKTINSLFGLDRIRDERPTAWPLSADDAAHRRPSTPKTR